MANSNGWGDGSANNAIGWGQGAVNNSKNWGDSHAKSWAGLTDIVGVTTDADAQAFITAAAITDPTQQTAIDTLVKSLKSNNIWTKMKAVYPFVGGTASSHKFNLKDPRDLDAAFRLVFNGGWTHSANGATPNGTNGYADTKFVPSVNFSANNNSLGAYLRTENINAGAIFGTQSSGNSGTRNWMFVRYDGTNYHEIRNNTSAILSTTSPSTSLGYWMSNRNIPSQQKIYRNGTTLATGNNSENTFSAVSFSISAQNNNGSSVEFSNRQLAFFHIGDGLTDTEAANLYTAVQAFQTSLSRQV